MRKPKRKMVKITCNQCSFYWEELDGVTQGIKCPNCKKWDVTIENI